jgi:hypothetical protein
MRDKRYIPFIQYVVGVKKAAVTPPYINQPSAIKLRRTFRFVVRMFAELYYPTPRHPIHSDHSPSYPYLSYIAFGILDISHPLYLVRLY